MNLSWTSFDPIRPQWTWTLLDLNGPVFDAIRPYQTSMDVCWTSLDPMRPQLTCLGPHWTLLDLNEPVLDLVAPY